MLANMLAAAALVALLAVVGAEECASASFGSQSGTAYPGPDLVLAPGLQDYAITVNDLCPSPTQQVGTSVNACDDVRPSVSMADLHHGVVHRNGNYQSHTGVVHTTVYCV